MSLNDEKIRKAIKGKKNVSGYVKTKQKRMRDGVEVDEEVIVVLVEKKVPLETLALTDLIPDEIDGIPTDVIVSDKIVAMGTKDKIRPLVAGYSIGHINITAGTMGYYYKRISDGKGPLPGSNKHVFSDVLGPTVLDKRIVQPGPSDGGELPIVGHYFEGTDLKRALNPLNALWMILVNWLYQLFGKEPPYDITDSEPRNLDFAVMDETVALDLTVAGLSDWDDFCGVWFAGSDSASFFCKAKYITEFGYEPIDVNVKEARAGDMVYKGDTRTTPRGSAMVIYESVFIWVGYGGFGNDLPFDNVTMTEKIIEGGDSGGAVFLEATFA